MWSLLSAPGAERRNNHQGDKILSTNTNSLQKYMEISQEKLYLYRVV